MLKIAQPIVNVLRLFPSITHAFTDPKNIIRGQKFVNSSYRQMAKSGFVETINAAHPNEAVATLGKEFTEMLQHPLAKKYLRSKPNLYLDKATTAIGINLLSSPQARTAKTILFPESVFNLLSAAERKAVAGHELGHILALDMHPRRGLGLLFRAGRKMERRAEEIGVVLAGEPEAMKSALRKVEEAAKAQHDDVLALINVDKSSFIGKLLKRKTIRDMEKGTELYDSMHGRSEIIDAVAEQISTEKGRSYMQAELERRLEKEHRKLFPHLYNRPGGVTRE